jgi:hypothetical protein
MTVEETAVFFGMLHRDASAPWPYNWREAPVRYVIPEEQEYDGEGRPCGPMPQYRLVGLWAFDEATQTVQVALRRVGAEPEPEPHQQEGVAVAA